VDSGLLSANRHTVLAIGNFARLPRPSHEVFNIPAAIKARRIATKTRIPRPLDNFFSQHS
jgi:hypothetical protein